MPGSYDSRSLVLASNNAGKLRELTQLLEPLGIRLHPQSAFEVPEAEEPAVTFVENALIKARNAALHSGLPALADDSGLAVDALNGAPGVRSARYAGAGASDDDNIRQLLRALDDIPERARGAQFHCVLAYLRHPDDPTPIICHGVWPGLILDARRGKSGFGYDPVFWVPDQQCSAAELASATKSQISHRGQALTALLKQLRPDT
jgi:XTP/dITP diphosphohydrolase